MGILGKKKVKDEEVESSDPKKNGGEGKSSKKTKRIRDLNPENKRKRKEPIRPWNKLDRIILLILILVTFGTSFYFAISSRGFKFPNFIPDINPFSEKIIVLKSTDQRKANPDDILGGFQEIVSGLKGTYGFYVVNLTDGRSFGLHESESFQAASLIKLPVMLGMYKEEEAGEINLDTIYILKEGDKLKGSGSLYGKPIGYKITYRNLIKLMGKESDNTAFNICRKYLGDEKINSLAAQVGMNSTHLNSNETSPYDIGLFFRKLYDGELVNDENKDELLSYMTDTIYENWLVKGLPEGVKIAHKYGRETGIVNDAGIVFSNPPYIVVVMSKNAEINEANDVFPEISKLIYEGIVSSR